MIRGRLRGRGRRHRRRRVSGQPRRAARSDRRPAAGVIHARAARYLGVQPHRGRRDRPRVDPRQQGARGAHHPRHRRGRVRGGGDLGVDPRHQHQRGQGLRVGRSQRRSSCRASRSRSRRATARTTTCKWRHNPPLTMADQKSIDALPGVRAAGARMDLNRPRQVRRPVAQRRPDQRLHVQLDHHRRRGRPVPGPEFDPGRSQRRRPGDRDRQHHEGPPVRRLRPDRQVRPGARRAVPGDRHLPLRTRASSPATTRMATSPSRRRSAC